MPDPIFTPDGDDLVPGPRAAGPWFDGVQHGGAVAGVVARAIERVPSAGPMRPTRLTLDLTRRVPMGPTRAAVRVVRDGRRVQALEVDYLVAGEIVARATCTRIRTDPDAVPAADLPTPWPSDLAVPPRDDADRRIIEGRRPDFVDNFEYHRVEPEPGRATSWLRLRAPFVADETTSPFVLACATADLIMSAGTVLAFDRYLSANPDLTVNLHRLPESDWIGHTAMVRIGVDGIGQTDAELFDERGFVGRALKSLLIDPR